MRLEWIVAALGIETEKTTKQAMYQDIHKNMAKSLLDAANLQKFCKGLPDQKGAGGNKIARECFLLNGPSFYEQ